MNLKGKTAVITGASSGIGRATAIELARRGANVVLAARRAETLESVATECRRFGVSATVIPTDVTNAAECERLITKAGATDILINSAGFATFDPLTSARVEELRGMMETNYFGTVYCTRAVLPQMIGRRNGTIVNVGSITGIMGYARMSGYCATKFAVTGFTEAIRDEVIGHGVRVALVCPGTTDTDFFVRAERGKMPGASRLMPAVTADVVARAIADAAEDGAYRRIMPTMGKLYMRFKEISPRFAHALFRRVSAMLERK